MFITISTDKSEVTIDGKVVPFVDAFILVNHNNDVIHITLKPLLENKEVISNVSIIEESMKSNTEIKPEILLSDSYNLIIDRLKKLGYNVKPK